jgi:hypothetical protein
MMLLLWQKLTLSKDQGSWVSSTITKLDYHYSVLTFMLFLTNHAASIIWVCQKHSAMLCIVAQLLHAYGKLWLGFCLHLGPRQSARYAELHSLVSL